MIRIIRGHTDSVMGVVSEMYALDTISFLSSRGWSQSHYVDVNVKYRMNLFRFQSLSSSICGATECGCEVCVFCTRSMTYS